jgi:hypothetical protein
MYPSHMDFHYGRANETDNSSHVCELKPRANITLLLDLQSAAASTMQLFLEIFTKA